MAFNPADHLMTVKGHDYLKVAWRLVWFREEKPLWSIDPVIIELDADHAIFRACIFDENGVQKCAAHGSETKRDFPDYMEKAETKAIGRALAILGYGTQFVGEEFDEGERLADAPIALGSTAAAERVGAEKLEQINAQLDEPKLNANAKYIAAGQLAFIRENAKSDEFEKLQAKYGENLERMTMAQASANIAILQKRINGGK